MTSTARAGIVLAASLRLAPAAGAADVQEAAVAPPRPAAAILADLDAVEWPGLFSGKSAAEVERMVRDSTDRTDALTRELWAAHPDHPRLPAALARLWTLQRTVRHDERAVFDETSAAAMSDEASATPTSGIAKAAVRERAFAALALDELAIAKKLAIVDAAVASEQDGPFDGDKEYAPALLVAAARTATADPAVQRKLLLRVLEQHAATTAAKDALALHAALKRIGTRVDLDFDDAFGRGRFRLAEQGEGPVLLAFFTAWNLGEADSGRAPMVALKNSTRAIEARRDAGPRLAVAGVVLIHDDSDLEVAKANLEALGLEFPIRIDRQEYVESGGHIETKSWSHEMGVRGTPWFVRVGPDGTVERMCERVGPLLAE